MARVLFVVFVSLIAICSSHPTLLQKLNLNRTPHRFPFVTRAAWGARPPTAVSWIGRPVDLVVIHHTYQPGICHTLGDCKRAMRSMQDFHQLDHGWSDIGYNFAVGGEGSVYEGRAWDVVGAHAVGFNTESVGIALIGDFRTELPPLAQRQAAQDLIAAGVELGFISPNYRIRGHRELGSTECPGDALFQEISNWNNFNIH